jgi:hypothetical protein
MWKVGVLLGPWHAYIQWSTSLGIEPATFYVLDVRFSGSPKKHSWHMWPHTTYVSNYDRMFLINGISLLLLIRPPLFLPVLKKNVLSSFALSCKCSKNYFGVYFFLWLAIHIFEIKFGTYFHVLSFPHPSFLFILLFPSCNISLPLLIGLQFFIFYLYFSTHVKQLSSILTERIPF